MATCDGLTDGFGADLVCVGGGVAECVAVVAAAADDGTGMDGAAGEVDAAVDEVEVLELIALDRAGAEGVDELVQAPAALRVHNASATPAIERRRR